MGEIADDMVCGLSCSGCGMYFKGEKPDELYEHGYPVVCWDCWKDLSPKERKDRVRAKRPTL